MSKDEHNDHTRSHTPLLPGTMVAHYRLIEKIGAGGMGEVHLAEDTRLHRRVALKFLPLNVMINQEVRTRFMREAQAVAKLNHPNIVTVHDVSEFNGRPYYVMEHIHGKSLHHFAHDEPLPIDIIIEYAIQICQGLGDAHRSGIVHRDIKADNIAIDSKGRARILDFGLAATEGDEKLTKTGSTLGTVAYMSPEQVSGRPIDHRSDLFSLGVVLYELIAGRTPFRRESEGATLTAILQDAPEPLHRYKSDVPDRLQHVVMKLLEKDKELRYQTAEDIIADLKKLLYDSQQTGASRAYSAPVKPRRTGLWVGVGVAAVLVAAVAWILTTSPFGEKERSRADAVPMIAVLPFENLGAADDEYFADGMTEEITSRLAGIKGLGVISRTSAMKYKGSGKTVSEIGRELGVSFVLEGTVRWSKVGDRVKVRITPQLVEVADDRHLWADNYERDLLEVFAVQAEIASEIVEELGVTLLDQDRATLAMRPTENPKAYEYYLKGLTQLKSPESDLAIAKWGSDYFDSAVAIDPEFALAYAMRSQAYSHVAFASQEEKDAEIALESAEKALELQPNLPQGHVGLGMYYNFILTDYDRALGQFNLAKSELHNDPDVLGAIALVQMRQGRFAESQENYRRAAELDPLSPDRYGNLSYCLALTRSFDEATTAINRALALAPQESSYYISKLRIVGSQFGDWERLEAVAREALKHCDTTQFVIGVPFLVERLPEVDFPVILDRFAKQRRSMLDPQIFYPIMISGSLAIGDTATALLYADSARQLLEEKVKKNPDDPHRSAYLGLTLALLGDCDRAEEYGLRGKELLSVDECHW